MSKKFSEILREAAGEYTSTLKKHFFKRKGSTSDGSVVYNHPLHGDVVINKHGEWDHRINGKSEFGGSISRSLDKHLSRLNESMADSSDLEALDEKEECSEDDEKSSDDADESTEDEKSEDDKEEDLKEEDASDFDLEIKPIDESVFVAQLGEDLGALLEGEFSDEFKAKAQTIFEAAVAARVKNEVVRLNAFANQYFTEQVNEAIVRLEEATDEYINHVATTWLSENAIAVESAVKVQIAESIFEGFKGVLSENNIVVPEGSEDLLESAEAELAAVREQLAESEEARMKMAKTINESAKNEAFRSVTKSMTDLQASKFKAIAESVEFTTAAEYTAKLNTLRENFIVESKGSTKKAEETLLSEGTEGEESVKAPAIDPGMASLARAISRTISRNK